MKLKVYSSDGSSSQEADFNQIESFEGNRGRQALKEVIVAHRANARQGTHSTKTRAEVSGGGKKPYRQKGTGNARAGSVTSPIWSGGGVVFGPKPRDYSKKINKKVKSLALRRILFDRATKGDIDVIESFDVQEPKTAAASRIIRGIAPKGRVLLVEERFTDNAILAARNLRDVDLAESASVNTLALAGYSKIIFTRKALDNLVERLNGGSK
jgi:large subunit ribosomal protein L4